MWKLGVTIGKCCLCLQASNQTRSLHCCPVQQAPASFSVLPLCASIQLIPSPFTTLLDNHRQLAKGQVFESWGARTWVSLGRDMLCFPGIQPQAKGSHNHLCTSTILLPFLQPLLVVLPELVSAQTYRQLAWAFSNILKTLAGQFEIEWDNITMVRHSAQQDLIRRT